jgi:hypothetical protein
MFKSRVLAKAILLFVHDSVIPIAYTLIGVFLTTVFQNNVANSLTVFLGQKPIFANVHLRVLSASQAVGIRRSCS